MVKALEIINLSYQDFSNLNLTFEDKTYYSIIGSNNCGKTTLFRLIAGFIASNDVIYCNGICLNKKNINKYIINLGIVERINEKCFINKMVIDEMLYPLCNLGYSRKKGIQRVKEVLHLFEEDSLINKMIDSLNYYEKQLLLIMIAILHKPRVLLLDSVLEIFPFSYRKKITKVFKKLVSNMTIINFTSSLLESNNCDKIILLDNYQIIGQYTPNDIYINDQLFYTHNLEIPFIVDLSVKLKMYGLINKKYNNIKEMVDDIWP